MSTSSEQTIALTSNDRLSMLRSEIEKRIDFHEGKSSFWGATTTSLRAFGVLSSATASFLGLAGFDEYVQVIGVLAAVPVVVAFIGSNLKCTETVQWHTDFRDKLENLKREILFELPIKPSEEQISSMSVKYRKICDDMSEQARATRGRFPEIPKPHEKPVE